MEFTFETFKKMGLGMPKEDRVVLKPYNPQWALAFDAETARLREISPALRFHHVGSTSIPGVLAKPILDMIVTAPQLSILDELQLQFEQAGYTCKGEYGIPGRRYSTLYNKDKSMSYVHIHAYGEGHPEVSRHLAFRDYLRKHPDAAKAYEKAKMEFVNMTREAYTEAKAPFIQEVLAKAKDYFK